MGGIGSAASLGSIIFTVQERLQILASPAGVGSVALADVEVVEVVKDSLGDFIQLMFVLPLQRKRQLTDLCPLRCDGAFSRDDLSQLQL